MQQMHPKSSYGLFDQCQGLRVNLEYDNYIGGVKISIQLQNLDQDYSGWNEAIVLVIIVIFGTIPATCGKSHEIPTLTCTLKL